MRVVALAENVTPMSVNAPVCACVQSLSPKLDVLVPLYRELNQLLLAEG